MDRHTLPDHVEEPMGGETACWAHLLDDEGRMPDTGRRTVPREDDREELDGEDVPRSTPS